MSRRPTNASWPCLLPSVILAGRPNSVADSLATRPNRRMHRFPRRLSRHHLARMQRQEGEAPMPRMRMWWVLFVFVSDPSSLAPQSTSSTSRATPLSWLATTTTRLPARRVQRRVEASLSEKVDFLVQMKQSQCLGSVGHMSFESESGGYGAQRPGNVGYRLTLWYRYDAMIENRHELRLAETSRSIKSPRLVQTGTPSLHHTTWYE